MISLLKYFLLLGSTGFGGPLSLIQQMRQHFVDYEKSITAGEFDQAFTLVKAMPGPIAFQMAVFCSQKLHGRLAGVLSGIALILPAFIMMIAAGLGYQYFSSNPFVLKTLNGFQFAVAGVILFNVKNFFQNTHRAVFWTIVVIAAVLFFLQLVPEPLIIIGFGVITAFLLQAQLFQKSMFAVIWFPENNEILADLYRVCAIAGAIVFGTGLALFPVLQQQLVYQYHWLDLQTFNDGVTFGQMTPGPVTISATFFGYKIAGIAGATLATAGIFTMPLFHMITWFPMVLGWMSRQKWISKFLLGATAAVVGVLLITIYRMNESFITHFEFWLIFGASFAVLYKRPKTPILLLIGIGGLINLIIGFATI